MLGHAQRAGRPLRMRARVEGVDGVCRIVAHGVGVAVVPERSAARWPGLARVRLTDPWSERRLHVVTRAGATLTPPARRLADYLLTAGR